MSRFATPYNASATRLIRRLLVLVGSSLALTCALLADTPSELKPSTNGCYCHCAKGRERGSCVKMCEMPKYASRWWATSCAKPHAHSSKDNPGAGPHLRHRDRAEHARL